MTDETTTEQLAEIDRDMADIERQVAELVEEAQQADYPQPQPQPVPVQVREGRWRTRCGEEKKIRPCEPLKGAYYVWPWTDGFMTFQDNGLHQGSKESDHDLVEYLGPIEPDKTQELPDKTQELETKTQELPEYTPPEGWRVLAVGEVLRDGDVIVHTDDAMYATARVGGCVGANQRYIRPIESQAEPEPQPVQVREGRWRTRGGLVKSVTAMPTDHEDFAAAYPWWDGVSTWRDDGRWLAGGSTMDLVEYLGPIKPQAEPVPAVQGGLVRDVTHLLEESGVLDSAKAEEQIEELRSEVAYVQNLLGESRQRVTQLEELVSSLRTINEAQEKAFTAAGKENTALRNQLEAVKAELASVAADRYTLQIELDAAQQVPADSPELRQLRADLEQVTLERDTYRDGYERVLSDLETARETAKAEAVEAIAEWLEPIRAVDHLNLSNEILQHLPQIMRHLTGLNSHAID